MMFVFFCMAKDIWSSLGDANCLGSKSFFLLEETTNKILLFRSILYDGNLSYFVEIFCRPHSGSVNGVLEI